MSPEQLLIGFGLDPNQVVSMVAGAGALCSVLAVWSALLQRDPMAKRAKQLRQRQKELAAGVLKTRRHATRRLSAMSTIRTIATKLRLLQSQKTGEIAEHLSRCGWRSKDAVMAFLFLRLSLPVVFGIGALVLIQGLDVGKLPGAARSLAPFLAAGLGAYAPILFVRNAISRREAILQKALPDALDLLVICTEAGLSLDAALTRAASEMGRASPELGDELGLTAVELGFLPDRRQALLNLTRRCQIPALRGVVNTLIQTEKYGTPLASSLRVLSAEFRHERLMKAEEKAARLPAVLTVPMIVFILPVLVIVLTGPAIIRTMDAMRNM